MSTMDMPVDSGQRSSQDRLPFSPAVGCALAVLIGALCTGAFVVVLGFNQRGEIAIAPEPYRAVRLWIVRDGEGRGLGLSTTRPLPNATSDRVCAETSVRFLLTDTRQTPADVRYCECFARVGVTWSVVGACLE
jgi:hypothetical protein